MEFAYPLVLLAIVALLPFAWLTTRRKPAGLPLPSLAGFAATHPTLRMRLLWLPAVLRALAIALLVVSIARPRTVEAETVIPAEGIDIVLTLDISGSMETSILRGPSRLDAAIAVLRDFISQRQDDRIGLVVFSEFAQTLSPPTLDYRALQSLVDQVAEIEGRNATGIGIAIAESVAVLQQSPSASRVVILLTDGVDNVEEATRPRTAAQIARALGVRVYTIGIVSPQDPSGVDHETLEAIAEITGAVAYRAQTVEDLKAVYEEIDSLETSGVERDRYTSYTEYGPWLALVAAGLVAADLLLRTTWLRRASA
ncbi:MAG: VWA domain-containing protein [Dehalococcoidia bacterium]|nr:VWA domain-containing protein [Dehalococcoidia bacterium]MCA9845336.1 VWA domain-containing protein [Dehalococcoidia bacterium]